MVKIGVIGAGGRVGKLILKELSTDNYNVEIGLAVGREDNKETVFENSDVIIDFTTPDACLEHMAFAHQFKTPMVIGTTGLKPVHTSAIIDAATHAPILYSANMSLPVNLLFYLVENVAKRLDEEFDIEIFEAHHRNKVDAPSGTALALGEAAAKGRGITLDDARIATREGHIGERIKGSIGISVFRGGDVVGEHKVTFAGMGERLELSHKASDRSIFAKGAIKAALWLVDKPAGLYSMQDMLEF